MKLENTTHAKVKVETYFRESTHLEQIHNILPTLLSYNSKINNVNDLEKLRSNT